MQFVCFSFSWQLVEVYNAAGKTVHNTPALVGANALFQQMVIEMNLRQAVQRQSKADLAADTAGAPAYATRSKKRKSPEEEAKPQIQDPDPVQNQGKQQRYNYVFVLCTPRLSLYSDRAKHLALVCAFGGLGHTEEQARAKMLWMRDSIARCH